jgi:hypothetical protein
MCPGETMLRFSAMIFGAIVLRLTVILSAKNVLIDGDSYTVVGIAPKEFHFPEAGTNVWVPLLPSREQLQRSHHAFLAIGRMRPGVALQQANQQLNVISGRLALAYPETDAGLRSLLIPLKTALMGSMQKVF